MNLISQTLDRLLMPKCDCCSQRFKRGERIKFFAGGSYHDGHCIVKATAQLERLEYEQARRDRLQVVSPNFTANRIRGGKW